jgi:hypothetical protein
MPTNGKPPVIKPRRVPKATAAQQRARAEYLRRTGHTITAERIEQIRSQWVR